MGCYPASAPSLGISGEPCEGNPLIKTETTEKKGGTTMLHYVHDLLLAQLTATKPINLLQTDYPALENLVWEFTRHQRASVIEVMTPVNYEEPYSSKRSKKRNNTDTAHSPAVPRGTPGFLFLRKITAPNCSAVPVFFQVSSHR